MSSLVGPITGSQIAVKFLPRTKCKHHDIVLIDQNHPERVRAEALVQKVYRKAFQAQISTFYPFLLAIRNSDGSFAAVAGIRPAGDEFLFSEHYLDRPADQLLGIPRNGLVEVGNLAAADLGQMRWIITAVNAFLHGAGFSQVIFTAVPLVHNAFKRLGLQPVLLADARLEDLPEEMREEWGVYYKCNPVVCTGSIDFGYQSLFTIASKESALNRIRRKAVFAGQYSSYTLQVA